MKNALHEPEEVRRGAGALELWPHIMPQADASPSVTSRG
jgi:hypothetical protein